jgi:succinate-acetate transporter protein
MAQFTAGSTGHADRAVSVSVPLPLSMGVFGLTTVIIGCIFAGFIVPSVGAGMTILAAIAFFGGLIQAMTGMAELRRDDTLSGTIFTSYGAFLMAFGVIVAPSLGILSSLGSAMHAALGLFFLAWTVFSAILFLSSLRTSAAEVLTLALLFLTYLLLTIGELAGGSTILLIAGGWLGVATGLVAWYTSFAGLLSADRSVFRLPF